VEAVAAVRHAGMRRSHYGRIGGKPRPLRAAPADCGTVPALQRSAVFELQHRSWPLGIRRTNLVGRRRGILAEVVVPTEAEAVRYTPAVGERIQLNLALAVTSERSTISSFAKPRIVALDVFLMYS
jgi:hypothetical protein